jgi:hypothetical protein
VSDTPEVAAARTEVERRRAQLMDSAHALQERLSPGTLARGAWQGAKEKGADLVEDGVDAVRARPLAATGVIAALALFFAREPLFDLAGKVAGSVSGRKKTAKKPRSRSKQDQTENAR